MPRLQVLLFGVLSLVAPMIHSYDEGANTFQGGNFHSTTSNFNSGGHQQIIQSNGNNNIVISRRMGPNNVQEDYISMTNPKIRIDGDYFSCAGIQCPAEAFKCVVTSEAVIDNIQNMRSVAECMDKNDKVLESKEYIEENPSPHSQPPYSRHVSVTREGVIHTEDSNGSNIYNSGPGKKLTKEEEEELIRNINEQNNRMNIELQKQQQQFQESMKKMQENLQNAFGNGFPFGNNFGSNFPFGNSNPFAGNFPFNYAYSPNYYNPYPYGYQQKAQNNHYQNDNDNNYD